MKRQFGGNGVKHCGSARGIEIRVLSIGKRATISEPTLFPEFAIQEVLGYASMWEDLLQPFTVPEVTKALFHMAPLKSPGPDGMSPIFFQKFWSIVNTDVVTCVLNLLNSHVMPPTLNATNIVLIPKCKHPEHLSQFRPISLCNVVYKIASKAIANRMKPILDKIISPSQSAFVPGRLISDNILLAFELNHFINSKSQGKQGWMALKLDVSKAYDKVEWSFLEQNGEQEGRIRGLTVCRGAPSISHLLFADDTLIFCQASPESSLSIRAILETYRSALGQEINFSKSSVAFSKNKEEEVCHVITAELTIRSENKMELYLGLPTRISRSKRDLFATIRDSIWRKITGWNEKLLSQARNEVLIKSVIQAVPTYAMGCFLLPITLLKEIQGIIGRFWWGNRGKHKIHWLSWNRLCESKLVGGLGFRQLHLFNLAMLAKHWWCLLLYLESLLSRVLKARYFPTGDVFSATLGSRPSFTWRSIMAAQPLFRAGCSTYHLACSLEDLPCSSSVQLKEHTWWRKLWQGKIPSKIKVFVWRACLNALPTGKSLSKRLPGFSAPCPFCQHCEEDVLHSLVLCPFARQVWGLAPFHLPIAQPGFVGFREWLLAGSTRMDDSEFQLFMCLCWSIWWCRNEMAMRGRCLDPSQVVCFASQYLLSYLSQIVVDVVRDAPKSLKGIVLL
ncbi:putative mitochondrial protein [Sesamum angolense]|uniref:Mitochondrial protein n=1 Tax=Sesamum angolense TaxID=2727404 RepID=A0AAE1W6N4_9LAMI|nr:putative mitochondrial protein [Sesamum angolense]